MKNKTFKVDIQEGSFEERLKIAEESLRPILELSLKLGVSIACSGDILHLRLSGNWTQSREDEIISRHREGNPIPFSEI